MSHHGYQLIVAKSKDQLEKDVCAAIEEGFAPCGAPSMTVDKWGVFTFFQAVWRPRS